MTRANLGLSVVLVLAALQRILYLAHYPEAMPFFAHPLADARVYETWSSAIAAGDVWSRAEGIFYRAPLYPYWLAGIRWLAGNAMPCATWIQSLLGLGALAITARVGSRVAGPWAGVFAALLLALYGPLLAYESKRLPTTLGIFLHTASLLFALRMIERPTAVRGAVAGLTLGLSALVRPQWLLLAPLFAWILAPAGARRSFFARSAIWMLVAAGLVVVTVTARNYWIGHEWVPISSNGGMTFYQGNNPENRSGLLAPAPELGLSSEAVGQREVEIRVAERISGERMGPAGASHFWFRRALDFVVEQPEEWLRLEWKKLGLLMRSFEYPDNYSFLAERARVWPLRLSPLPFGALLALATAGAAFAVRDKSASSTGARTRAVAVVLCSALAGLLSCLAFYVSSRYRIDAAPALAVLGGVAVTRWLRLPSGVRDTVSPEAPRSRWEMGMLLLAGALTAASFSPVGAGVRSQESMSRLQLALAFDAEDRREEAARAFAEATDWYPENFFAWRRRLEWVARNGTPQEAKALFEEVPASTRSAPELQYVYGILCESTDDDRAAEAAYRSALAGGTELPEAAARLGGLRARAGAFAEAESLLAAAAQSPNAPSAVWVALAEVRVRLGDLAGARSALQSSGMRAEELDAALIRLADANR